MDFQVNELKQVAKFQRFLILAVAAGVVLSIASKFIPYIGILCLVTGIASLVFMIKLSQALKQETGITIVYAICAFIPIVSLVALYLICKKASNALTEAGYKVGLFGMSQADIDKMQ